MNAPVARRRRWPLDVDDLFDTFLPMPWRPLADKHPLRIEEYVEQGNYVIRAELPGIDPDKDVEITVGDGVLNISAERTEEKTEKDRSEFRYGSFVRQIALPREAKEEDVTATYDQGILTVKVALGEKKAAGHKIAVKH
ncbi:MAG TPA: Hsp20/alpha crystallin family protein [Pseudonocardiaceae bacterium]